MDAKISTKTKNKTFQNLNKNCPLKLTEASKSQKIDSKFSTKTKTKTFQNLNMPPP